MLPQTDSTSQGACYLEKHIDDVMGTFSRGSTFCKKRGPLATTSDFQCVLWPVLLITSVFSTYELMILLLSLKYYIGVLENGKFL